LSAFLLSNLHIKTTVLTPNPGLLDFLNQVQDTATSAIPEASQKVLRDIRRNIGAHAHLGIAQIAQKARLQIFTS